MLRVVAVVVPPQASFELACVADIFGVRRAGMEEWAEFLVAAETPGPVATKAGFRILVEHGLAVLDRADIVFVTGWPAPAVPSPALTDALLTAHANGSTIAGLCTGTYALAATGLLDGRTATTHWSQTEDLSRRYPLVRVTRDVLFVDHGDVATSGGAGAAADLALHLVRRRCGPELADVIARHMVLPPHRQGGQRQYALDPRPRRQPNLIGDLLDWCLQHLGDDLTLHALAKRAGVAPRTLHRRFRSVLGTTPAAWVLRQRIARAATLLQTTDVPVAAVGAAVGLRDPANFRAQFRAETGTSPSDYRRTFTAPADRTPGAREVRPAAGSTRHSSSPGSG